jgi:hypothetical protein
VGKEQPLATDDWIVEEAEAFLSGEYGEFLRRRGAAVPDWVQLNPLAHGDIRIIRRILRRNATKRVMSRADRAEWIWRNAQRMLASEVIELAKGDPELLSHVQRRALVPLEFRLMCECGLTAYELVLFTRTALHSNIR